MEFYICHDCGSVYDKNSANGRAYVCGSCGGTLISEDTPFDYTSDFSKEVEQYTYEKYIMGNPERETKRKLRLEESNTWSEAYAHHLDEVFTPKCPRCGSKFLTTGQRGFSIWTGFIGSNRTVNRCGNCGHTWYP